MPGFSCRRPRIFRPRVELLEDRCVPSVFPATGELTVSEPSSVTLYTPVVAATPDGRSVVAYTDGTNIRARLYDSAGDATTGLIQVSQFDNIAQGQPSVAMDANGDFVVTWQAEGVDGSGYGILARRYNAAGYAQSLPFVVNQAAAGDQTAPHVAMDSNGDFVVAWQDGSAFAARLYNSAGNAANGQFAVAGNAVAMDAAGDFVVAASSGYGPVTAQRYNLAGVAQGGPITVSQSSNGNALPAVAMDPVGAFVVAWESDAPDGSSADIHARRFTAAGNAASGEFTVNLDTVGYHVAAGVSMDATGGFVVSWENVAIPGQGLTLQGANTGVCARRFDAAGTDVAGEMQVNPGSTDDQTTPNTDQTAPAVAMDSAGDFVVAWQDDQPSAGTSAIGARLYLQATAGYSYDAATRVLTITAEQGGNYFRFDQVPLYADILTNDTFTINQVAQTYPDGTLARVQINYGGTGNDADLYTDQEYTGIDGQNHETVEEISLGQAAGQVYRINAQNHATLFLQMTGFSTACAYPGEADSGQLLATAGVANTFVTTPTYSYMDSGSAYDMIIGAKSLYGYAANSYDVAYHYTGFGSANFVVSGTTYSYMTGTSGGVAFYNEADGFRFNYGIGQDPGLDDAYFYDSAGNDVFSGRTQSSYMYADHLDGSLAEYDYVQGFSQVYANSFNGGTDDAYVYDTSVNHVAGNWHRIV